MNLYIWLIIVAVVLVFIAASLVVGFAVGYFVCARRIPNTLSHMDSHELSSLAGRVTDLRQNVSR